MLKIIKNSYHTEGIAKNRKIYNLKVCYKQNLQFLKNQDNTLKGLSNRLTKGSNFIYSFKNSNYLYIKYLRANFSANPLFCKNYRFKNVKNNDFILIYNFYKSMNDINRSLIWRASQINSIFKAFTVIKKKRKKYIADTQIFFITEEKRILSVWTWFKYINLGIKDKDKNFQDNFFKSIDNFFSAKINNNLVFGVKLTLYKMQLLRVL